MDKKQFQQAAKLSAGLATRWFSVVSSAMDEFGITTPLDQAMFIAQIGHESEGFTRIKENFNYTPVGLLTTFGRRLSRQQAYALGRCEGQKAQPQAIANLVYANRMGNKVRNDGWLYHGRGLIQITGRENYAKCGAALNVDLISEPELLEVDSYAARSAAWFFTHKGCLLHSGDIKRVTLVINGGTNGLADRARRFNLACSFLV